MPTDRPLYRIERFDPDRHDRSGFSCGVARLDNYLLKTAKKHQTHDATKVYVIVEDGSAKVRGYHAIGAGSLGVGELPSRPKWAPGHGELPALFLGQIAVSNEYQGQNLGGMLMHHVFEKARVIAEEVGCYAIILDVMDDGSAEAFECRKAWYAAFGFQPFPSSPARMFMTMKQVRQILESE